MGQRAFRGKLTDSLIKNYLHCEPKQECNEESLYFCGKPVDLDVEFNLDNPLLNLDVNSINLTRGIINSYIPKGGRINTLNLTISSSLFGEKKSYLHSNLYILFGSYFHRDINRIFIRLYNPISKVYVNDRKIINSILDFMCFKTIKVVNVNKRLLYYIIPENSDLSIVLAYREMNKNKFDFTHYMEELYYHPYCLFEANILNFMKCVHIINQTVPKDINNIILPIVLFNNVDTSHFIFTDLIQFLTEINERFQIISFEIKVKFNNDNCYEDTIKRIEDFIHTFIENSRFILENFTHCFISFDFSMGLKYRLPAEKNEDIIKMFKKIIKTKSLYNVTFANHSSFIVKNNKTSLDDQYEYYDYIYYDKCASDEVYSIIQALKYSKFKQVGMSKYLMNNIIETVYGKGFGGRIFKEGRIDYSTEYVKNSRIVPFELSRDNSVVFTNDN